MSVMITVVSSLHYSVHLLILYLILNFKIKRENVLKLGIMPYLLLKYLGMLRILSCGTRFVIYLNCI
jgi:hypothetical protein